MPTVYWTSVLPVKPCEISSSSVPYQNTLKSNINKDVGETYRLHKVLLWSTELLWYRNASDVNMNVNTVLVISLLFRRPQWLVPRSFPHCLTYAVTVVSSLRSHHLHCPLQPTVLTCPSRRSRRWYCPQRRWQQRQRIPQATTHEFAERKREKI